MSRAAGPCTSSVGATGVHVSALLLVLSESVLATNAGVVRLQTPH